MKERLTMVCLRGRLACLRALERLAKEEKGASDIVAILLVIVILIAVAAIFRNQLIGAVNKAFETLNEALGGNL